MSSAVARTTERSLTSRYPSLRGWWNEAAKRPSIRTGLSARVRTICPRLAGPEDGFFGVTYLLEEVSKSGRATSA